MLYVGDAMMTGRVLHRAKFPYAFSMKVYLESLAKLRQESADRFIVAHRGVYREILPLLTWSFGFDPADGGPADLVGESTTPRN